jgi:hypothetical protein
MLVERALCVAHAFTYKQPDTLRGLRVLAFGCSISALDIASDLIILVLLASSRQTAVRTHILHKLLAGVPLDQPALTRFTLISTIHLPSGSAGLELRRHI